LRRMMGKYRHKIGIMAARPSGSGFLLFQIVRELWRAHEANPSSAVVQVFGRRLPQRVESFVMPASKNLHRSGSDPLQT